MANNWVCSLGVMAGVMATVAIASTAQANEPPTSQSADIPTAVNEVFFTNRGPFSNNRGIGGQLQVILGSGGFAERRIARDADAIFNQYVYLLEQQTTLDPTLRVPDLVNPYETTVQFLPAGQSQGAVSGSEFIFEPTR